MARRLVLTVRRVGADMAVTEGAQHRSITEGPRSTAGSRGSPTDSAKSPRRLAAYKKALARFTEAGWAQKVSSLAKRATSGDARRGVNRLTAWPTAGSGLDTEQ
jgi:hypothetical protein